MADHCHFGPLAVRGAPVFAAMASWPTIVILDRSRSGVRQSKMVHGMCHGMFRLVEAEKLFEKRIQNTPLFHFTTLHILCISQSFSFLHLRILQDLHSIIPARAVDVDRHIISGRHVPSYKMHQASTPNKMYINYVNTSG